MKAAKDCKDMSEIREAIDTLDHQIISLISKRAEYVKEAAKFKKDPQAVQDPQRVRQVIETKKELARQNGLSPELVGKLYQVMIAHFVEEEMKEWKQKGAGK